MLKVFRKRMEDDKGFTLIELMVVVLIIAILLAIAIPTFLRVRRTAQDRQAQSSLSDALKAEKAYYVDDQHLDYTESNTELESIEPSVNYQAGGAGCTFPTDGPNCVEVTLANTLNGAKGGVAQSVVLVSQSASGTFWALRDVASGTLNGLNPGTYYNDDGDTTAPLAATNAVDANW